MPTLAYSLPLAASVSYLRLPACFSGPTEAKRAGDHIALDDLVMLETIAANGAAGFYTGPVAQKIVAVVQVQAGG